MLPKIEVQTLNCKYIKFSTLSFLLNRKLNVEKFLSLDRKSCSITKTENKFIALQLCNECIPPYYHQHGYINRYFQY